MLFTKETHFISKETHLKVKRMVKMLISLGCKSHPKESRAGYPKIRQNRFLSPETVIRDKFII